MLKEDWSDKDTHQVLSRHGYTPTTKGYTAIAKYNHPDGHQVTVDRNMYKHVQSNGLTTKGHVTNLPNHMRMLHPNSQSFQRFTHESEFPEVYGSENKNSADNKMTSSKITDRFKNDVALDQGDWGNTQKKYAPGPTYEDEMNISDASLMDKVMKKHGYTKGAHLHIGREWTHPEGHKIHSHMGKWEHRPNGKPGPDDYSYGPGAKNLDKYLTGFHKKGPMPERVKHGHPWGVPPNHPDYKEEVELLGKVLTEAQTFDPKTKHTENDITDCAVCGEGDHVPAKHFGKALAGENNQPVKEGIDKNGPMADFHKWADKRQDDREAKKKKTLKKVKESKETHLPTGRVDHGDITNTHMAAIGASGRKYDGSKVTKDDVLRDGILSNQRHGNMSTSRKTRLRNVQSVVSYMHQAFHVRKKIFCSVTKRLLKI